jgi:DNA-directed RNA polymerase specialized sigma24 family protein
MRPEQIQELVVRAVKAVRRMDRDPDLEGVAHEATVRAIRTYDPQRCDNVEAWVVYVAKVDAKGYLRKRNKRREVPLQATRPDGTAVNHEPVAPPMEQDTELLISRAEWELLIARYVDKYNDYAIARKLETTVCDAKRQVNAAVTRLVNAYCAKYGVSLTGLRPHKRSGRKAKRIAELVRECCE